MIDRMFSMDPRTMILVVEAVFIIGFMAFSGVLMWRMDRRSKETHRRLKASDEEHRKALSGLRRRQEVLDSLIEDGDDIVERVIN